MQNLNFAPRQVRACIAKKMFELPKFEISSQGFRQIAIIIFLSSIFDHTVIDNSENSIAVAAETLIHLEIFLILTD